MAISVVMPALEMAQETGKLISWLKKEGEAVAKGEPLLEIETDKAVMEVESPGDGVLAGIKAQAGAEIPVGRTIAWIVKPGEALPAEGAEEARDLGRKFATATVGAAHEAAGKATTTEDTEGHGVKPNQSAGQLSGSPHGVAREVRISPKARRLAAEKGVDLATVKGSGPGGEIQAADIEAAAASVESGRGRVGPAGTYPPKPKPGLDGAPEITTQASGTLEWGTRPETPQESLSAVARLMAERTAQSWTTVPHFFVVREVDATALNAARQSHGEAIDKSHGVKLTHSDLLVALVARVLAKHPKMNSSWDGGAVRANSAINISLAMAVSDGVVAPVIPHADRTNLGGIALQRRELAERARTNKLKPGDLAGGTFTISNLGMFEVDAFTAIITPPQAAILAVGRIAERVVAIDGKAVVRPMVTLTLSSDHRVVDGARAAEFMRDVADAIRDPEKWLGS